MTVTVDQLSLMAGVAPNDNMRSVAVSLDQFGAKLGLDLPHRLAHYLPQLLHENGNFKYDQEIASGAAYEGRKDLGNTQPGDGTRFKGRTGIQITGRSNYRQFTAWCRKMGFNPPDFEDNPELVNTDPWEGLAPLWYWSTRKLNALADDNDIEQITKKINGGLNGYADRIKKYVRVALVLNGYGPKDVLAFQTWAQLKGLLPPGAQQLDGDPGPKTRAALHMALAKIMPTVRRSDPAPVVKAAPVVTETEVEKEVPVVAEGSTKRGVPWLVGGLGILSAPFTWFFDLDRSAQIMVGTGVALLFVILLWRGELIIKRIKTLAAQIGE
jgi:putative chitinase